jgi:hypothetical protein
MFGVGALLNGAFGLVRERIGAVGIWGALYFLCTLATMALVIPMNVTIATSAGGPPDPAMLGRIVGPALLLYTASLVILVVLFAAAFRAVLHPDRSAFGYLRFGMDELRLLGLALLVGVASVVGSIICEVVIVVIGGVLAVAVGAGSAVTAGVVLALAWLAGFLYLQVRFSLAGPLSIYHGRFVLGESWTLTRGRFWSIFGAYLVIFAMFLVIYLIFSAIIYMPMLGAIGGAMRNSQDPAAAQALSAAFAKRFSGFSALTIGVAVFGGLIGALWVGLNGGAAATAVRLLVDDRDVAATFE